MKNLILLISIYISLFSFISFAKQNNGEPSLSTKIKNSHYYSLDFNLWDFFKNINFNGLINDSEWVSSLNFERSVIDYYDNKGVLIDTISLPIAWNIANKNIKNLLPEHLPSDLSASLSYKINFGLIAQRILVIPEEEEFKKEKEKDWVHDVHKELLQTIEASPLDLKTGLKNNILFSNSAFSNSSLFDSSLKAPNNLDTNSTTSGKENSWRKRVSSDLVQQWDNFLYQMRFNFNAIQYKYFFNRFLYIFKIPIKAKLAKQMSMQETISYTAYGVHTIGPSFSYNGNLNLNINAKPFYIVRSGQFKVQVLRLDTLNANKVLLKFSHLVSKGSGSSLQIGSASYLVEKIKNTLNLTGSNFFKKALAHTITPILNFSKNQAKLSVEERTQSYEFDLSYPDAVKAYNYAAMGMTHRTEEIIKRLKPLGDHSPVKIRQKNQLKGQHSLTSSGIQFFSSNYKWRKNCEKQLNQNIYSFKKENQRFLDTEQNLSCDEKTSLKFFNFFSLYDEKKIYSISSGALNKLDTTDKKEELYTNALYAYEFKNYKKNNGSYYYNNIKKQIEYFNLISNQKIKLPCLEYKTQKKQTHNYKYNWSNAELLNYNKNIDKCTKKYLKNIKMQIKINFSDQDIKKFYMQKNTVIIKAIQKAFQEYIDSSILLKIKSTPYLEEEEIEKKIREYENNLIKKDMQQYNFVVNVLDNQHNLLEKALTKGLKIAVKGLEILGLPYNKEIRLEAAMKQLFTSWKKINSLMQRPEISKKMTTTFYQMFVFPEFSKEYIHFLSIVSNYSAIKALYLKQDGKQILNK